MAAETNADAAGRTTRRKTAIGTVVSAKGEKTISVDVVRVQKHGKYEKYIKRRSRLYAHDEQNAARAGDRVEIMETRPLSKTKRWRLVKVLRREEG